MNRTDNEIITGKVCDFAYLSDTVNGKKKLMIVIMDIFLDQVKDELKVIDKAVSDADFQVIMKYAHTIKSSVSIMGISILVPVLQEMEMLARSKTRIQRIKELHQFLNATCIQAFIEIEKEKNNEEE
jgi:HPt (histidine-containing phosphotransfer) domain-containing protein